MRLREKEREGREGDRDMGNRGRDRWQRGKRLMKKDKGG